jgi:hypothetical protein
VVLNVKNIDNSLLNCIFTIVILKVVKQKKVREKKKENFPSEWINVFGRWA